MKYVIILPRSTELLYASGMQGDMSWLGSYVDRLAQDKQQVENTYRRIISQKVFEKAESHVYPC